MKRLFLATLLFSAIGCGVEPPPASEPSASTATTTEELHADPAAAAPQDRPFCRNEWECDVSTPTRWFATQATCEAACGVGNCLNTPHCMLGCVCP